MKPTPSNQPQPNSSQREASLRCAKWMIDHIYQAEPDISFYQFMQSALYAPGVGYYTAGLPKFGEEGDFITAPLISPLFAQCLARAITPILQQCSHPSILECGPGDGTLMCQLLAALEAAGSVPEHYYCLELSAELQQRQQAMLQQKCPQYVDRVTWLQQLPSKPINGVILANEVLDAMPIELFEWHQKKLYQMRVAVKDADSNKPQFHFIKKPADDTLQKAMSAILPLLETIDPQTHYRSEFNPALPAWTSSMSDCLQQGMLLAIDYGYPRHEYYHQQREMGTLTCYWQHQKYFDPLTFPGIMDITAQVDFSALAYAASDAGFAVRGYTTQASFLNNCGLADLLRLQQDPVLQFQLSQQVKRLIAPQEMGELFKVIALSKGIDTHKPPLGFQQFDLRHLLAGID